MLAVHESSKLWLLAASRRTHMFTSQGSRTECRKVVDCVSFVLQVLEAIERLSADNIVTGQVFASSTERNQDMMIRPIGHVFRQTQFDMPMSVGSTEKASGGDVVHLRWQSIDDSFIG
jgi:hypothetical protein